MRPQHAATSLEEVEMMEAAFRRPAKMDSFARAINAVKKFVVSSTLDRVDWNAELVRGDLATAVHQLKQQSGKRLEVWGVKWLPTPVDLKLVSRHEFGSGAVEMRYELRR